jgi:hypothetical protein
MRYRKKRCRVKFKNIKDCNRGSIDKALTLVLTSFFIVYKLSKIMDYNIWKVGKEGHIMNNSYYKKMEMDMAYIIILLMAVYINYNIVPDYIMSTLFRMDISFLLIQFIIFVAECLKYLNNQKNADIQEDIEIMNEMLNDTYEKGYGKLLFNFKSILIKLFLVIVLSRFCYFLWLKIQN